MHRSETNSSPKRNNKKIRKKELCAAPGKKLSGAALRALQEAAERRRLYDRAGFAPQDCAKSRLEPTRYGDWETDGKCSDF